MKLFDFGALILIVLLTSGGYLASKDKAAKWQGNPVPYELAY